MYIYMLTQASEDQLLINSNKKCSLYSMRNKREKAQENETKIIIKIMKI